MQLNEKTKIGKGELIFIESERYKRYWLTVQLIEKIEYRIILININIDGNILFY